MFLLTEKENTPQNGAYASIDKDGTHIIQFFVNKEDAITYNTQMEALDFKLYVSEIPDDMVDNLCDTIGVAYSIVQPGEIVIPRLETYSMLN